MDVSMSQLRMVVRLVENGSFTAAAAASRISQPSVSRTIQDLEGALGVTLFERTTRSVVPTPDGRELYAVAKDIIRAHDDGLGRFAAYLGGQSGSLTVSALPSLAASAFPYFAARLLAEWRGATVSIVDANASENLEHVRNGRADIALTEHPGKQSDLAVHPLGDDDMVAIVPKSHVLNRSSISWEEVAEFPFIAVHPGTSLRRLSDQAFAEADIRPKNFIETNGVATAAGMVAAGLGVSAVTRSTLPMIAFAQTAVVSLHHPKISRRIALVHRASPSLSPVAAAFAQIALAERIAGLS